MPIKIIGENKKTSRTAKVTTRGDVSLVIDRVMLTSGLERLSVNMSAWFVLKNAKWLWLKEEASMDSLMILLLAVAGLGLLLI